MSAKSEHVRSALNIAALEVTRVEWVHGFAPKCAILNDSAESASRFDLG